MGDPAANWSNCIEQATLSDVGLRRSNNQDSFAVVLAGDEQDWYQRGHVFMVADGMGAHAAGELASKLACNNVPHTYHKLLDRPPPDAIRQAITEANAHIHERGQASVDFQGMGTTSSVLILLPYGALVGHVGDSRVYRLRNHRYEQLTFDHSLVWEMMAAGQLPKNEVPSFVPKNIITRSLGPHASVQVDVEGPFPLEVGDTFLLCSDGLSGPVTDDEMGLILGCLSPQEAVRVLVDLANLRGGPDNITVLVARVVRPINFDGRAASKSSSSGKGGSVHPALWVVMGVCLLAALGMWLMGNTIAAFVGGLGAALSGIFAMIQMFAGGESDGGDWATTPNGTGPHTARECLPSSKGVEEFRNLAGKLREAAVEQHWNVDWQGFDSHVQKAQAAAAAGKYAQGIRENCLAISHMMNQIRRQGGHPTS